jgi:1-acyl-sn-glycerol-3-phosphate acyltransferase
MCGGTVFVNRESRTDTARVIAALTDAISSGGLVVFFPEGTSTDASRILPFRSALFEPAAAQAWPTCPAWIDYALADGQPGDEVCYWREMTFLPHLLNLFSKAGVSAALAFGDATPPAADRKALARELQSRVEALKALHARWDPAQ